MYSKEPVWLLPEDIISKFDEFCSVNNITSRRLIKFYGAFLLRGRFSRHSRQVEILLESFIEFQNHIRYTLFKQGSKSEAKITRPAYLVNKYNIPYDKSKTWFTPKDLLDTYALFLKYEKEYTTELISELTMVNILAGKYQPSESCYHILCNSFVEILKFREYNVSQYKLLPPSG